MIPELPLLILLEPRGPMRDLETEMHIVETGQQSIAIVTLAFRCTYDLNHDMLNRLEN